MNAHELYDKMAEIRDEYWNAHRNALCDKCNEVFTQMLSAAFTNEWEKNQLPKTFYVYEVNFSSKELEELMMRIGLNVTIKLVANNYAKGNSFEVIQAA